METDLQQEDLLIQLRAKLNEGKIKLWEPPYIGSDGEVSPSLKTLAQKYATELGLQDEAVLQALCDLQQHSIERSKDNAEYKETGCATFRIKATIPGEKTRMMKIQKKLSVMGSELLATVAELIQVQEVRVKLIVNGKVIKATPSLDEQGVKNGAMIMALVMAETPEEVKKEDTMYMEMKTVRDDATLLSEYVDELADDDEYMRNPVMEQQNKHAANWTSEVKVKIESLPEAGSNTSIVSEEIHPVTIQVPDVVKEEAAEKTQTTQRNNIKNIQIQKGSRLERIQESILESNKHFKKSQLEMLEVEHEYNIKIAKLKMIKLELEIEQLRNKKP